MRYSRCRTYRGSLCLIIAAAQLAAISQLSAMKGNSGEQDATADGTSLGPGSPSLISITVDGVLFSHMLTTGELAQDARDQLVTLINADPNFQATSSVAVPAGFDPDDVVYQVLTASGTEVTNATVCETDANYQNSGVHFAEGKTQAFLLKPTSVAGGGTFDVRFHMLVGVDVNQSFPTVAGDVTGLIAAITNALTGLGFTVVDSGAELAITKTNDRFLSVRVGTDDANITATCVELRNVPSTPGQVSTHGIPTLGVWATIGLGAGLLLLGVFLIVRRMQ